ncbi:hypothetical protein [Lysobacter sp. ESA13C]|uniref:hypothetical protein n=1 Tax=Lysobacter sp. ESA13C TaxID=2862676 RepID=UPI001CBE123A|nr:hypothetical protein [Lysobacter sp. ESA13C]
MARIPHIGGTQSTFGQRGPDRPSQFNPSVPNPGMGVAGLQQVAGTIGQIAQQQLDDNEALARAKASNALLDHELQVKQRAEDLQQRISSGDLDWRQAEVEAKTAFDEIETPKIAGLGPADVERMQGGFTRNKAGGASAIRNVAESARRTEFRGQFDTALDSLGKLAGATGADIEKINAQAEAFAPIARQAGVESSAVQAKIQAFKDRNWTNQAIGRAIGARDSMEALAQLKHDLTAEDGYYTGKLDTDKRNAILSQVDTSMTRIEAKAQHQADRRDAIALRAVTQFQAQASSGVQAPLETMAQWAEAVKGTQYEAEFQDMLKGEAEVQAVLNQPPTAQRAYLQQLEVRQRQQGATMAQQGNLKRLTTAVETNLRQLKDSPLEFFANRTGQAVPQLDIQALASGDAQALRTQIAERMTTLAAVRKQFGPETGNAPLLPAEAASLSAWLTKATPVMATRLFGTLSQAIADPAAYSAAMQQIAPDSPVRAFAGMVYAEQRSTTLEPGGIFSGAVKASSGDIAQTLLEGEALLNKSKGDKAADGKGAAFPMPTPKDMAAEFEVAVGAAFRGRPGAADAASQAVRAYYAGKAAKDGDLSGELDSKRMREAVRAVLGEPVDVNGADVFAPWGMDEDTFVDKLELSWAETAKALPAGASTDFDDYTLMQRGNNAYYLVGAGGQFLTGKDGQPLQLKVSK